MAEKMWGAEPFWGLGYEWDPDWVLTERQKELRAPLIELCEKEMRANAKRSDDELLFPRRNLELLGEHGFLALTVPEEYGGLGENHVAYAMTCETIARYGCASTAMCYVMHIGAVKAIMLRPTPELIDQYIRPLEQRARSAPSPTRTPRPARTSGTRSRPAPSASNGGFKVRKKASWTTSARLRRLLRRADDEPRLHRLRRPLGLRHRRRDVEAQPSLWDALGLRGNQSGPLEVPERRDPRRADRRPGGRRRRLERRVRRPVVPDRLLVGVERHRARRDRHRQAPHDPQAPRRRRPARRRLPDDPGLRRRGADGHERVRACSSTRSPQAIDQATDDNTTHARPSASSPARTTSTGRGRSSSRRRRTSRTSSTRCCTPAAAPATSATWSSSATCATPRPAGSWARRTRCCASSSARPSCSASSRSTTGTSRTTAARSRTRSRSSTPPASASSPSSSWRRPPRRRRRSPRPKA